MCLFSKHFYTIELHRYLLCFIAIAKNLYNVFMLKHPEAIKLISELLLIISVLVRIISEQYFFKLLHSNILAIFSHCLLMIYCQIST